MMSNPNQMKATIGEKNGKEMTAIHKGFCAPEAAKSMCLKRHMKSVASRAESTTHIQVGATAKSTLDNPAAANKSWDAESSQAFTGMVDLIPQLSVKMILLLALASVRVSHVSAGVHRLGAGI